mgnify:CR=1 FL=1|jgi:nucleotide-binding universal stress UspA family protein
MKKILVPIDFSIQSKYATELAAKIAAKTDAEVFLLHMVELPSGIVDMGAGSNFSIPESMMYLRMVKDKIIQMKSTLFDATANVHHAIRFQNPHEGILSYSKKIEPDLIVMGSKGASDFDEILIGSNTEKVVRTSQIPVLVVKNSPDTFKIKELIFASNFKEESKKSFTMFLDFATTFESNIHLLIVNTIGKFETTSASKEKIANFLKDFPTAKHALHIYNDVSIEKGILNFAKEINADLIALSTHGRSGLSHLFNGSISKNLTKSALRPVITFKI